MSHSNSSFLRRALIIDAVMSGATGVLLIVGPEFFERLFNIPATLLRYAAVSLIPFVAYLVYLSRRNHLSPASVWLVIALNASWVVGSVLLLLSSQLHPNALGYAFVIVQALAVAAFAEMQYVGLRRVRRKLLDVDSAMARSTT